MKNKIASIASVGKDKADLANRIRGMANLKENFPKFFEFAKDSRKDHVEIIKMDVETKMTIAQDQNSFYSEIIRNYDQRLLDESLSEAEKQLIWAEKTACMQKVDARYNDVSEASSNAIEEDRNYTFALLSALLIIATGGVAYELGKAK